LSKFTRLFRQKKQFVAPVTPHSGFADQVNKNFRHSGKAGDIIYSLPVIKELNRNAADASLYLNIIQPHNGKVDKHFNEKSVEMLLPLLERQSYIKSCELYHGQPIDIDLDAFRYIAVPLDRSSLSRWYFFAFNVHPDLNAPWLEADRLPGFEDKIVLARSKRYQNPNISRDFLNQYKDMIFIGTEQEYRRMKEEVKHIEYIKVSNFLEMANIINSCKLFIGNQSMPFAIAEALKVPRLLEVSLDSPNVIPYGDNGYDFIYQDAFEELVRRLA
jgi:hypothetical protein